MLFLTFLFSQVLFSNKHRNLHDVTYDGIRLHFRAFQREKYTIEGRKYYLWQEKVQKFF